MRRFTSTSESLVIRGAQVLDESGGFERADVRVADGLVADVGLNLQAGEADKSVDADGLWLMPGVVDCHAHLTSSDLDLGTTLFEPVSYRALRAADNARRTLEAGVTTLRDAGGSDAGIRAALAEGLALGPRLLISVVLMSQTGGHADGFLPGPGIDFSSQNIVPPYPGRPPFVFDGVDGMRRAVRTTLRAGADWIKLCTTGGILSPFDDPLMSEFSEEEVAVAVWEAERQGRGVMVHCMGGEGLDFSVRAGVRSIEHGLFLTEEQAAAMAAAGVWLIPTLLVMNDVVEWGRAGALPEYSIPKAEGVAEVLGDALQIARAAGVRIALGSDALTYGQHGRNLEEIALMVEFGMPIEEALIAATARGAELCGLAESVGRITPGTTFDALLLDAEPSAELFRLDRPVTGVFKAGIPVVPHERLEISEQTPVSA